MDDLNKSLIESIKNKIYSKLKIDRIENPGMTPRVKPGSYTRDRDPGMTPRVKPGLYTRDRDSGMKPRIYSDSAPKYDTKRKTWVLGYNNI